MVVEVLEAECQVVGAPSEPAALVHPRGDQVEVGPRRLADLLGHDVAHLGTLEEVRAGEDAARGPGVVEGDPSTPRERLAGEVDATGELDGSGQDRLARVP